MGGCRCELTPAKKPVERASADESAITPRSGAAAGRPVRDGCARCGRSVVRIFILPDVETPGPQANEAIVLRGLAGS